MFGSGSFRSLAQRPGGVGRSSILRAASIDVVGVKGSHVWPCIRRQLRVLIFLWQVSGDEKHAIGLHLCTWSIQPEFSSRTNVVKPTTNHPRVSDSFLAYTISIPIN